MNGQFQADNTSSDYIKEYVVKAVKNKKLIISLPSQLWEDEEELKKTMKDINSVTENDIIVNSINEYPSYQKIAYNITIVGKVNFLFIQSFDSNGEEIMEISQLPH